MADIILIASLLVVALVLFLVLGNRGEGNWAVVEINGVDVARYSLAEDGRYSLNGGTNILVIQNGSAMITEADCPDKICVKQGSIKHQGQTIVCLPNKLQIKIVQTEGGVDLVI